MIDLIGTQYRTLQAYLLSGGMVMVPLVLVSLCMSVLIVERLLFFRRLQRGRMTRRAAWEHLHQGLAPGENAGVVGLLVARFLRRRGVNRAQDRFILDEAMAAVRHHLDDFLTIIGVLAAMAPLLGLLGTVTGMITTFDVLTLFGTGNPKAMAGGISEALITTETGLVIAIPGLYMKAYLDRWALSLKQDLESVGCHLRRLLQPTVQVAAQETRPQPQMVIEPC
ncbi:MAG: MotA/TolQ/ExbB proton channel family protein [Desulfatitalea sp.]